MRKIFYSIAAAILTLPAAAAAQRQGNIDIDFRDPVPVPRNVQFGIGGLLGAPAGQGTVSGLILSAINILLLIVGLLAVLFVIIGGIRYVTAHGNEEQAEGAKKTIIHAVVGIVIVVLSFVIIRIIVNALVFSRA